ncbi:hypothetical protein D9C73_000048 [Collichthys lucidus]|uniref:Uncharacterized protein n=1 Tax=Collichthys lucidus TaxID=240159 RepID=A0A4V6ALY8_COLLU|nr:hypothetical protein D9C73_000048 [Collichthys lucidus]
MAGRRNVKGQKGDENMPKLQEKSNVADQASNAKSARASTGGQATAHLSDTRPSMAPEDIITAINELKTDIKKGNEAVKNEIVGLRQEINGKLDKLATEVQEDPVATEGDDVLEKQLAERLGWKLAANPREGSSLAAQRARAKLLGFRRKQAEESGSVL